MASDIIEGWEPSDPEIEVDVDLFQMVVRSMSEPMTLWCKREIAAALRAFIVEDGIVGLSFDDQNNPIIKFWAGGAQYEDLTCTKLAGQDGGLAEELHELICDWLNDANDAISGGKGRLQLSRLRDVLSAAVDKIDNALLTIERGP